jgi:hypothetical protein
VSLIKYVKKHNEAVQEKSFDSPAITAPYTGRWIPITRAMEGVVICLSENARNAVQLGTELNNPPPGCALNVVLKYQPQKISKKQ